MTYTMTVKSNTDSDIQPVVASLEHPDVTGVVGIDTDRVRVTMREGADLAAYEEFLEQDVDVFEYTRSTWALMGGCR